MGRTRRSALLSMLISMLLPGKSQFPEQQSPPRLPPPDSTQDEKLPNGKSQKDAIAKEQHEQALKDTNNLITVAEQLKDELQKAGDYVVPLSSVKKTEEIEKLARRIRGRLKQ